MGDDVGRVLRTLSKDDEPEPPFPTPGHRRIAELKAPLEERVRSPESTSEWIENGRLIYGMLAAVVHGEQPSSLLDKETLEGMLAWYTDAAGVAARLSALGTWAESTGLTAEGVAEATAHGDLEIPPAILKIGRDG
jgi:hypothetical protein